MPLPFTSTFTLRNEVYEVMEGELEMTIDSATQIAPSNIRHSRQGSHRRPRHHCRLSGEA